MNHSNCRNFRIIFTRISESINRDHNNLLWFLYATILYTVSDTYNKCIIQPP